MERPAVGQAELAALVGLVAGPPRSGLMYSSFQGLVIALDQEKISREDPLEPGVLAGPRARCPGLEEPLVAPASGSRSESGTGKMSWIFPKFFWVSRGRSAGLWSSWPWSQAPRMGIGRRAGPSANRIRRAGRGGRRGGRAGRRADGRRGRARWGLRSGARRGRSGGESSRLGRVQPWDRGRTLGRPAGRSATRARQGSPDAAVLHGRQRRGRTGHCSEGIKRLPGGSGSAVPRAKCKEHRTGRNPPLHSALCSPLPALRSRPPRVGEVT